MLQVREPPRIMAADVLRLASAALEVHYFPEYLARETGILLGFFAEEGLIVEPAVIGSGHLVSDLATGRANLALSGAWRPLMCWGRLETFRMFAMLCVRSPQILLSRAPIGHFEWTNLYDRTIFLPAGAPSQWMLLKAILGQVRVTLARIRFVGHLQANVAALLFRAGLGGFLSHDASAF